MLEWLKEILGDSYTEEIDKKVSAEIGKAYDVTRNEGLVMEDGDAFDQATMNDLESRVESGINEAGVYCSASWAQSCIDMDALSCPVWLAYYYADPKDPDFDGCASIEEVHTKWGSYMSSLGDKLCGWQFGRIGYGGKYGVGSVNVDRDWIYFQPDEEKEELPMFTSDTLKIGPVSTGDRATIRTLAESLAILWPARWSKASPPRLYCADRHDKMKEQKEYAQRQGRDETVQTSMSADPVGKSVDTLR